MMRRLFLMFAIALAAVASAQAETRAWVDGGRGSVGEELVLNIETDQATATPDLSPLMRDFTLADQSSSRSVQWVNGSVKAKTTYAIALVPRREGQVTIPAIRVGNEFSRPVVVQVSAAGAGSQPASQDRSVAFFETLVDDAQPYVQQSVGLTVRFNYTDAIASGSFGIDTPDGASMQQVGQDRFSARIVGGREYKVAERQYVLVPERSGRLVIPAPQFQGRSNGDLFGAFFGGGGEPVRIGGQARVLDVQAQPAHAPQPWLPLRDLRLRYAGAAQAARTGEAATLTVEAVAEGATQAQMPELPAPSVPGAQVFADTPQFDETFVDGVPRVKATRRFSIVPSRPGNLRVPGMRLSWWDVRADAAKVASLPDLTLAVAPGGGTSTAGLPPAQDSSAPESEDAATLPPRVPAQVWPWLAAGFALLWLLTLLWALSRRRHPAPGRALPLGASAETDAVVAPWYAASDLKRALDTGTLDEIGGVLRGMHAPPLADLDAVLAELAEPSQREAVEQLRRARWADGDGPLARAALRTAFRNGPVWRAAKVAKPGPLPPLYPER